MQLPREFGRVGARRMVAVGFVVALFAAASVGVASAQSAGNTSTVDSCTTIDAPGNYVLTQNVTSDIAAADESCLEITASNVTLDGAGHTLAGSGSGHGIEVNGSGTNVSNVTVERLHASNWSIGVFYLGTTDGTIRRTVTDNNTEGIALGGSSRNELVGNTAYANAIAVAIGGQSQNNTIRNTVAVENKWGIHFERESGNNTVTNAVARNNTRWDYYSERNDAENTVRNLRTATATVSMSERNVALRSVTSPPALPRGTGNLDTYVEVSRTRGGPPALSLRMRGWSNSNSVSLWRHNGQYWSRVRNAQTDASANSVSAANLTEFGTFAVLADAGNSAGGPVTVTVTTDRPSSVQRTLTTVPRATPTATPTSSATATGPDASTATDSRPPTATEPSTASNPSGQPTTGVVRGENDATASGFGVGPVKLFFVFLGLAGLVALGVVAVRERR